LVVSLFTSNVGTIACLRSAVSARELVNSLMYNKTSIGYSGFQWCHLYRFYNGIPPVCHSLLHCDQLKVVIFIAWNSVLFLLQDTLTHLSKFISGSQLDVSSAVSGDLIKSALLLLQTLPATKQAVLHYVANIYDNAVREYFTNLETAENSQTGSFCIDLLFSLLLLWATPY
jgi:Integrator complex subunit 5 N-terminus